MLRELHPGDDEDMIHAKGALKRAQRHAAREKTEHLIAVQQDEMVHAVEDDIQRHRHHMSVRIRFLYLPPVHTPPVLFSVPFV
jgi:hypothetical protein